MADLNVMMREQATAGLQRELNDAVTNGDTEAAAKVADKIAALAVSSAPKAPPYGNDEIKAELDKQPWFGVDPKKSGRAIAMGRDMDPKKFPSAEAFAAALVKAVDEEFKVAPAAGAEDPEGDEEEGDDKTKDPPEKKTRRTDGPRDSDTTGTTRTARSGPWTKLSDAPAEVQKEIKRAADKFVSANAPKEQREKFITNALASHYNIHQQSKAAKK